MDAFSGISAIEGRRRLLRLVDFGEFNTQKLILSELPEKCARKPGARKLLRQAPVDAFPDCHVDSEAMYVEGDVLTWRFRFSGTHTGTFQGIPPSGRSFSIPGITILRFGASRCVERWSVADFLGMMIQIGAIPAPPAP